MTLDDQRLADGGMLTASDTGMLAATVGAGSELRRAVADTDPALVALIAAAGRPRAILVAGAGGSSAAGDVLAACAGVGSPIPVVLTGGPGLPGWVGSLDLVVAISGSGTSEETLSLAEEAGRRGSQVVGITPPGPLADRVARARGVHLMLRPPTTSVRARALLWRMAAPLLLLGQSLDVVDGGQEIFDEAADVLDDVALTGGPGVPLGNNAAKDLALVLAESLPLIWGTPGVGAAAARRFGRQLAENAGLPSSAGALPEAVRTHARVLAGTWSDPDDQDLFRDRVAEPVDRGRPHLVLLADEAADPLSRRLAAAAADIAVSHGIPVTRRTAGAGHPLVRFAELVAELDLASVYAGIAHGIDPAGTAASLDPRLDRQDLDHRGQQEVG